MTCWFLVIIFGRFIAYDWFYCEKTEPGSLVYTLQECKQALSYLEEGIEEGVVEEGETTEPDTNTEDAAPEGDPAETTNPADEPPAEPAPQQPAPGQEG